MTQKAYGGKREYRLHKARHRKTKRACSYLSIRDLVSIGAITCVMLGCFQLVVRYASSKRTVEAFANERTDARESRSHTAADSISLGLNQRQQQLYRRSIRENKKYTKTSRSGALEFDWVEIEQKPLDIVR